MAEPSEPSEPYEREDAYGVVAKVLHWFVFVALVVQFTVGYAIERADDLLEWLVEGFLGGAEDGLVLVHAGIGVAILVLATIRVVWRRVAGLPPWAEGLSPFERRLAHRAEQALYATMFLIPLTGLALVLVTGEDWDLASGSWASPVAWVEDDLLLGAHIATHLTFFAAFAVHIGLVLKHQLIDRDQLLRRML